MKAIVWSKDQCAFCEQAKGLLEMKGIEYEVRNISQDWTREQLLEAVPTARSVPQIFLDEEYVGGFQELRQRLHVMPQFSSDWFSNALVNFDYITNYLQKQKTVDSILEIGSHEGRSTCWMLENMSQTQAQLPVLIHLLTVLSQHSVVIQYLKIAALNNCSAPTQTKSNSLAKP
jgi:glutaredoxin 3